MREAVEVVLLAVMAVVFGVVAGNILSYQMERGRWPFGSEW